MHGTFYEGISVVLAFSFPIVGGMLGLIEWFKTNNTSSCCGLFSKRNLYGDVMVYADVHWYFGQAC